MSGSCDEEDLSERKELLPVQFGQVGPDLNRIIVVPRQRDGLKFRLFILAGLFQDAGQSIMERYQSTHTRRFSFFLLRNPFFELHRHSLEVVIGRIIGIRRSNCHGCGGERSFVRYPLYAAGAAGFWISTLERHAANLCYFCTLCQLKVKNSASPPAQVIIALEFKRSLLVAAERQHSVVQHAIELERSELVELGPRMLSCAIAGPSAGVAGRRRSGCS